MRRFTTDRIRRGAAALAAVLLVAAAAQPADARRADRRPGERAGSPFNLRSTDTYFMSFNEWACGIQQIGEVCTSAVGSSVGGGGFWPSGTANQYIFNSGLQIGARIGAGGGALQGDTVATFFFHASGPGAGSPTPFWDAERGATGGNGNIFASNRPEDVENWPDECYIDSPVFGRVKTLSELDTCVQYWDGDPNVSHFADSRPMGLKVTQHSLLWSFPSNKDIMFFIYTFENVSHTPEFATFNPGVPAGGYTLEDIYAAFAMDPDVSGAQYVENYATVVPELNMATTWQYDFETTDFVPYAPNFDGAPGFVGVKYLKSPVNTSDTTIVVRVGSEVRNVAPGEELGLTFFSVFTNGGIMSDAANAAQGYRYLSGRLLPTEVAQWCPASPPGMCYVNLQQPDDMRFYQSAGPFHLDPGESAEIVVAYIAGAPVPGTYNPGTVIPVGDVTNENRAIEATMGRGYDQPGFPSLFANAQIAQAIFDENFVLPAAPPSPTVTAIPGDRQVTVLWSSDPVSTSDPYAELATDPTNDLFDPDFRAQDFEGFRVYRKSNPSAPFTLIAQFDLANGITEQVTVLEEVTTIDGSTIVVRADTARVCPPGAPGCVPDSGLQFSLVDRGGSFPNPGNGPGLVNGIRYYYAVSSFDINSPFSGPSTLESARVLSNDASAVPRAGAPNIVAGGYEARLLGGDGAPLDPTGAQPDPDPANGTFSAPIPPTNGFMAAIEPFIPQLATSAATVTVRIDSVIPGNTVAGGSAIYHLTATGPAGTERFTIPLAIGYFEDHDRNQASGVFTALRADAEFGDIFNVDPAKVVLTGSATVAAPDSWFLTAYGRAYVNGLTVPWQGPRWFPASGSEPADPNAGLGEWWCCEQMEGGLLAGDLPGVDIFPVKAYLTVTSRIRSMEGMLSTVRRAADITLTWGANGSVTVRDETHNVDVPFHPHIRASYGFLTLDSFNGVNAANTRDKDNSVITSSDWTCVPPQNAIDAAGQAEHINCPAVPGAQLQQNAAIVPIDVDVDWNGVLPGDVRQGIALYITGELFFFFPENGELPAPGTEWKLRMYSGWLTAVPVLDADGNTIGVGNYAWDHPATRPAAVPGLQVALDITATTAVALTQADLDRVHTVPDPYYVTNLLENSSAEKRLLFVNLPPQAIVRVFTLSGVLIAALEHDDATGGGTLEWDLRNRNNQFVASGVYFFHVETPDGLEKVGKFTVLQYAQ